ncbi:hypothetical protein [Clostridium sp.]|uniref:hypothetical protein n=1 Tax=Clostridium sp. TaxID=1506 RepID=UPI002627A71D|nr:hypothetical protein [Clostridium sp.]
MTNVWNQVPIDSFDKMSGDNWVAAMVYFKDSLYVATARYSNGLIGEKNGGNIYRWDPFSCKPLINVSPDPGIPLTKGNKDIRMAVYDDFLYVAADNGLMRTQDGQVWESLSIDGMNFCISSIIEFKGYLYFLGYGTVERTDGVQWESIKLRTEGYGESMQVFNGYLYVGVGLDDFEGFEVWRSSDGRDWNIFHQQRHMAGHVHSMVDFNGQLYVGLYEGGCFGRTDGTLSPSPTHWEWINKTFPLDVLRLEVHKNILYMGLYCSRPDEDPISPVLYQTQNGTDWNPVSKSPQSDLYMVTSLLSHDENLYVGTYQRGDTGSLSLWSYSSEIISDGKNNHSLIDAIPVKLTEITEAPNEFELNNYFTLMKLKNFTLLKNEVDYFDIDYQFENESPEWCKEVNFDNKIFHVHIDPDYLLIQVCTEFCYPMKLQIQDANENVLKSTIGTGIQINCPSKTLKNQRVYLLISEPEGQSVRYNLTFAYVIGNGLITGEGMALKEWRKKLPPEVECQLSPILDKMMYPRIDYHKPSELLKDLELCTTRLREYHYQI